jgi:hypothetical protein
MKEKAITVPMNSATPPLINAARGRAEILTPATSWPA